MQWYYAKNGQQVGPVDEDAFSRLIQQGEIAPGDLVWNVTFGDQWVPASSIMDRFAPPSSSALVPAPSSPSSTAAQGSGTTPNARLMQMARESLRTRWGFAAGVFALYMVIEMGLSFLPSVGSISVGSIAQLICTGPLLVGFSLVFLKLARRSAADVGDLFQGFQRFGTALAAHLWMGLFILLWSLLLIVPGIIASYAYSMTFYVLADDPTVGSREAIGRSKEMMRGNKWKFFCLHLRFIGWAILCVFTFGIGFFWLVPYINTSMAHFYDDVRPRPAASNAPGQEGSTPASATTAE
ncbi:MAG: DUF975 family protein [Kiritimatiellia bacterium]|jgi:uncharacterized membrane protein